MGLISKPYTFTQNTTAKASEANANFDALYALVNGNINGPNLQDGSIGTNKITDGAVTPDKLDAAIFTITSTATLVPNTSNYKHYRVDSLAADITISNPGDTPNDGAVFLVEILDDGTERNITLGDSYINVSGQATPATTTANKWLTMGFTYDATLSKVKLVAITTEA